MKTLQISSRIKSLRKQKEMQQKQLGDAVGLSMQAISDIESGRRSTTIDKYIAIADELGVSLDYLVGRTDQKKCLYDEIPESFSDDMYAIAENNSSLNKEEINELIKIFRSLSDISRGKLLERAWILKEEENDNLINKNKNIG